MPPERPALPVPGVSTPIAIMRTGTFTDMYGTKVTFAERDLAAAAAAYNSGSQRAPLVIGHPKNDLPSYGTIGSLSVSPTGDLLFAHPSSVSTTLRNLVKAGHYRMVSASFRPPAAVGNPAPSAFYLKHVGFLGAAAPSVKGLGAVSFGEGGGTGTIVLEAETFVAEEDQAVWDRALFLTRMWPSLPFEKARVFAQKEATINALPYDAPRHRELVNTLRAWRDAYGSK